MSSGELLSKTLKYLYQDENIFLTAAGAFEKFIKSYYPHKAFKTNLGKLSPEKLKKIVENAFQEVLNEAYALSMDSFSAESGAVDYFIVPAEFRNGFTAALYRGDENTQYLSLDKGTLFEPSFWRVNGIGTFSPETEPLDEEAVVILEDIDEELEELASALHHILTEHNKNVREIKGYLEEKGLKVSGELEELSEEEYNAVKGVYSRVITLLNARKSIGKSNSKDKAEENLRWLKKFFGED